MICLLVALHAEAQPLIDYFSLEPRLRRELFPIYSTQELALVVSGVGKIKAAAAVAYLYAVLGGPRDYGWLNIGVAGHPRRRCGEGLIARRITEAASGRSWVLTTDIAPGLERERLITVDVPETEYATQAMYDMEAAGFYAIARRCAPGAKVQCFKVISDNRLTAPSELTPARASRLIGDRLEDIDQLIGRLKLLSTMRKR